MRIVFTEDQPIDTAALAPELAAHLEHLDGYTQSRRSETGPACGDRSPPRIGIVGAGLMGRSIADAHLASGMEVVLHDVDPKVLNRAWEMLVRGRGETVETDHGTDGRADRLTLASSLNGLADCSLVVESVVEDTAVKRAVFRALESALPDGAILTTNTSTIPVAILADELGHPHRFGGLHFCHPVRKRTVVEIVSGPSTSETTLARLADHALRIAKRPLRVVDGPGFVVNRLLQPVLAEAMDLVLAGASPEMIDRAARQFGMAMGPLRLMDEIGLDVALRAGLVLANAYPERAGSPALLVTLIKRKRFGRKSGRGFFTYADDARWDVPGTLDPESAEIVRRRQRGNCPLSAEEIAERLVLVMALEGARLVDEGRVETPEVVDLAALGGLGFPAASGGPLYWLDQHDTEALLQRHADYPINRARFETPRFLRNGRDGAHRFYPVR